MTNILITGASGGFGKEFTHYFDKDNNHLFLQGTSLSKLEELKSNIKSSVTLLPCDFSDKNSLNDFLEEIRDISFDVVINNSGLGYHGYFVDMEENLVSNMIDINMKALTLISHVVLKKMKEKQSGYLLNVGSVASYFPGPLMAQYYATKAYVLSLSSALYEESKDYNVVVSCLCPGPTKTEFHQRAQIDSNSLLGKLFISDPAKIVKVGIKDLSKKRRVSHPGIRNKFSIISSKLLPHSLYIKIMKQVQMKR